MAWAIIGVIVSIFGSVEVVEVSLPFCWELFVSLSFEGIISITVSFFYGCKISTTVSFLSPRTSLIKPVSSSTLAILPRAIKKAIAIIVAKISQKKKASFVFLFDFLAIEKV